MPIPLNLPNFLNAPVQKPDYSGIENLPMKMLQAYMMPMQMQRQKEEHELKQLIGKAQANYYNKKATDAGEESLTPLQREAYAMFGKNTPEANQMIQESRGYYPEANIPEGLDQELPKEVRGPPLKSFKGHAYNTELKDMNANLKSANGMVRAISTLNKMKELIRENPNLWKTFTHVLEQNKEIGGNALTEYFKNNKIKDEKTKSAIAKFNKLAGELVLQGADAFGSQTRFTDAKLELLREVKPDINNPDAANLFVIDNLMEQMEPGPAWASALRAGKRHGYSVANDPEFYRNEYKSNPEKYNRYGTDQDKKNALSNGAPKTYQFRGQTITEEDLLNTARRKGIPVEQLKQAMGI